MQNQRSNQEVPDKRWKWGLGKIIALASALAVALTGAATWSSNSSSNAEAVQVQNSERLGAAESKIASNSREDRNNGITQILILVAEAHSPAYQSAAIGDLSTLIRERANSGI